MARPNLLLLTCDQLPPHPLGCYGGPVPTPNLGRVADRGVAFTDATCPTPVCSPSRASLVLGTYPHTHGIRSNVGRRDVPAGHSPPTQEGIKSGDQTVGRRLAEAGYDTHRYGKFHLGDDDLDYVPDPYDPHKEYAQSMADRFHAVRERPREEYLDWKGWALPVEQSPAFRAAIDGADWEFPGWEPSNYLRKMGRLEFSVEDTFDHRVADRTVDGIRAADRPFFLTASFNWPHDPNVVPSPYYEAFDPEAIALPETDEPAGRFADEPSRRVVEAFGEAGLREFLRVYYGTVSLIDDQVGRILDALERRGVAEDTLVVFTADHGDMTGGHGMVWKGTTAFYEEVVRVPLLIGGPGVESRDPVGAPVGLTDIAPTLLEFGDATVPEAVQGRSLAPFLRGAVGAGALPDFAFAERVASNDVETRTVYRDPLPGSFMVRGEGWKYVRYPDEEFLYDLAADPGETTDRSGDPDCAERLATMRAKLQEYLGRTDYPGDPL